MTSDLTILTFFSSIELEFFVSQLSINLLYIDNVFYTLFFLAAEVQNLRNLKMISLRNNHMNGSIEGIIFSYRMRKIECIILSN
jgi:hypothetical protein